MRLRALLVTHYFTPEVGAPQTRLSETARHWARAGVEVTVLTGMPNHPTGVVPPRYRRKLRAEEHQDGYRVLRTWLYATPNERFVKKLLCHISFMISSVALGGARSGRADVVVVSSPTFFSIFSAWLLARLKRAKFVVEVRDLWPAIFVELEVLTNRWLIGALEALELAAYRAADAVVVVSEGFRRHILERGIAPHKVHTIRNGVDLDRFASPRLPVREARAALGATMKEILVLYIGAHGISHGLGSIADAAARLSDDSVHFAFVGDGAAKPELAHRVSQLGLTNVSLLSAVKPEDVPAFVAAADICLVPLRDVPLFTTFIPSKIFELLAAGKPVVGALAGEPAEILEAAGAAVVPPEDSNAIAHAIRELAGDPDRRARMSKRGREYVRAHFDRRVLAARYLQLLARLVRDTDLLEALPALEEQWSAAGRAGSPAERWQTKT